MKGFSRLAVTLVVLVICLPLACAAGMLNAVFRHNRERAAKEQNQVKQEPRPTTARGQIGSPILDRELFARLAAQGFEVLPRKEQRNSVNYTLAKGPNRGLQVNIQGRNESNITNIDARCRVKSGESAVEIGRDFLIDVASVLEKSSSNEAAQTWVRENVGKRANTTFDGVEYKLDASEESVSLGISTNYNYRSK